MQKSRAIEDFRQLRGMISIFKGTLLQLKVSFRHCVDVDKLIKISDFHLLLGQSLWVSHSNSIGISFYAVMQYWKPIFKLDQILWIESRNNWLQWVQNVLEPNWLWYFDKDILAEFERIKYISKCQHPTSSSNLLILNKVVNRQRQTVKLSHPIHNHPFKPKSLK